MVALPPPVWDASDAVDEQLNNRQWIEKMMANDTC